MLECLAHSRIVIIPFFSFSFVAEVLKPYVGAEAKRLELFARSLQPGWTSWGNEVLKFQHISYFDVTPADTFKDETTGDCTQELSAKL